MHKGAVAQLGEHRVCNAGVVGSSPSSSTLAGCTRKQPVASRGISRCLAAACFVSCCPVLEGAAEVIAFYEFEKP